MRKAYVYKITGTIT